MKDRDKEKLMGQRIISGADVTWELYWTIYKETPHHVEVLNKLKINILPEALAEIEASAGNPSVSSYQIKFMKAVEDLKAKNPDAIFGETTKLTRTASTFQVEVRNDEAGEYEMEIENRVKPKINDRFQNARDTVAKVKDRLTTAFKIPTLPKRQKSASSSKEKSPPQNFAIEFSETKENRADIVNFGFDIDSYRHSAYVQSEVAKLKRDVTRPGLTEENKLEEVLDGLRNEFTDRCYGAERVLRDQSPDKNQEKNYRDILHYGQALNNLLKACAEKTGAPEWTPHPKLIVPLQWMLAQRATPDLNALYAEVMANMNVIVSKEEAAGQQKIAAQKEVEAAQLKQWSVEMMNAPLAEDPQTHWRHYWLAYDEALQNLSSSEKSDREKSFEAHRVAGLVLGIDIKNLEDNDRTVFMGSNPEEYKQNFMKAIVENKLARSEKVAHAERAAKNEAKLVHLKTELSQMNAANFADVISEETISKVMALLQQYPEDRMVKEFVSLYMQVVSYFKQIAALEGVDPVERAAKIADLLLRDDGRAFQAIVAFTSFENVVSSRYAAEANPKNKPDIAQKNMEKLQLQNILIKPYQWLLKYKLHLPLINELVDVNELMEKFDRIGSQANAYKREIDPLVKQMEQVAKLENSGELTAEKTKEIISTVQRINRLMPGLQPLAEKMVSDSDTESDAASPGASDEENVGDYDDAEPVVIQVPGDNSQSSRNDQSKLLVTQYQHMRDAFAEGDFEKAKSLLTKIYAAMVDAKKPDVLGGDELMDELVKIIEQSQPTNFDVKIGQRLVELAGNLGETAYLANVLEVAVGTVKKEGKLLSTSDNQAIEKYNKIHQLFENNPDPLTMKRPRDVVTVTRAYREIMRHDIATIANAILQDPALADAFFKRRIGTRLPGRRNFRQEFAEHPELIEKLISSRDPVILASMRDTGLLQTSHLSEDNRARLVKFNTILNDLETFESLSPKEKNQKEHSADFQEGLVIRAEKFIDDAHRDPAVLEAYLQDEFFIKVLSNNPTLLKKLSENATVRQELVDSGKMFFILDNYYRNHGNQPNPEADNIFRGILALAKNTESEMQLVNNTLVNLTRGKEKPSKEEKAARDRATNEAWEKEYGKATDEHVASKVKFAEDTKFDVKEKKGIPKKNTPERSEQEVAEGMERMAQAGLDNLRNKKPLRSAMKGARDESILNNQEMLSRAAENLEKMKSDINGHQQACMKELDKIHNKELAKILKEKVAQHPSEKFPDVNQMQEFVSDINKNLKVEKGEGLNYKRYLILLTDSKYDGKFMSLFKLEKTDFPSNNKGFQRPLPMATVGKTVQAQRSDVKPHPSK